MDEGSLLDEQAAAAVVAALGHATHESDEHHEVEQDESNHRTSNHTTMAAPTAVHPIPVDETNRGHQQDALLPYPFFYYRDYSQEADPDPYTPLTPPGRVANFPAKMFAILARDDLQNIVCWLPHGRSWTILRPKEFEKEIIPAYFEHSKFTSFIRQANGWGFRRITTGRDRNSYYHPRFLRGLPHLCKSMKRPGVAMKVRSDPDTEPDFYKISEMFPVPEKCKDDLALLPTIMGGGPKARMPVYTGDSFVHAHHHGNTTSYSCSDQGTATMAAGTVMQHSGSNTMTSNSEHHSCSNHTHNYHSTYSHHSPTPKVDQNVAPPQIEQVNGFQQSLDAAERDSVPKHHPSPGAQPMNPGMPMFFPFPMHGSPQMPAPFPFIFPMPQMTPNANATLSAANNMAFQHNAVPAEMQKSQEAMQQFAMGFAMAAMMTQASNAAKAQPTHHPNSAQQQNHMQYQHATGPIPPLPFLPSGRSHESDAALPNQHHQNNM